MNLKQFLVFIFLTYSLYISYSYDFRREKDIINNPKDIVEYFLIFPNQSDSFPDGIRSYYQLTFENKKEKLNITKNRKVIIDIKNYYLNIIEFDGPFPNILTMALFLKEDNSKILAVFETIESPDWNFYRTNFFKYENKKWIKVYNEILPILDFNLLFENKNVPDYNLHYNIMSIGFQLPQKGTNIIIIVRPGESPADFKILREKNITDFDDEKYYSIFKKILLIGFELGWDSNKGIFKINKKIMNNKENKLKYNLNY